MRAGGGLVGVPIQMPPQFRQQETSAVSSNKSLQSIQIAAYDFPCTLHDAPLDTLQGPWSSASASFRIHSGGHDLLLTTRTLLVVAPVWWWCWEVSSCLNLNWHRNELIRDCRSCICGNKSWPLDILDPLKPVPNSKIFILLATTNVGLVTCRQSWTWCACK